MKVVELNEKKLVGIRVLCPGDQYQKEIPAASYVLKARLNEISDAVSPVRLFGAFIVEDCLEEEDGYWVCVEVNEIRQIPKGMAALVIPKQKYAVERHHGPDYEIKDTYERLHKWIEENKHERLRGAWHLEISNEWGSPEINEIEIDLYDTIR